MPDPAPTEGAPAEVGTKEEIHALAVMGYEFDQEWGWQTVSVPTNCPPCPYDRIDMRSLCFFSHRCMASASEFPQLVERAT